MKNLITFICLCLFVGTTLSAQNAKYIGSLKCKMCHNKGSTGKQYIKWSTNSHAKAYIVLQSDKAKEIAAGGDPLTDKECLKCHSTYYSADSGLMLTVTAEEGVSCESCHGPGSEYKSIAIMKDKTKAIANGLTDPTEDVCIKCHSDDKPEGHPTFIFNYDKYVEKVSHPNPLKK